MSRDVSCDTCLNSRVVVSENGYNRICCLSEKEAVECITRKKNHYIKHPAIKERKRVCCNCGNNKRAKWATGGIECFCSIDGHYIGYLECFEGWCRRWKKDRTFEGDKK